MINLKEVKAEVNRRVQQSDKVILGLLGNLVKSHNEYCGCNYCKLLGNYVPMKIELHHRNKLDRYPISFEYREKIQCLENEVKKLKKNKDLIKSRILNSLNGK